ncbi:histidine kinase [Nocardioides sp.]|uniref:sensor histidine kinase n=1 Tax=Nocardioides sp. TaxID=35761 RepID=UPI00262405A5|nr:histidine kinase [Nocardioides sp.]
MNPSTSAASCGPDAPWARRPSALGPWIACLWLGFLIPALLHGWDHRTSVSGVVGLVATLAFMALYTVVFIGARRSRQRMLDQPPIGWAVTYLGAMLALAAVMVVCVGEDGLTAAIFLSVATMMTLPLRAAIPSVVALALAVLTLGHLQGWGAANGLAFGTGLGSLAILGMRTVMTRNLQLWAAQEENTLLAVTNERNRFARDLHDILGHSLTVITVKAELAQRLFDVDPERARAEVADLERLSRTALTDVRRAVEGYRDLTLPGELARARAALEAAEIGATLPTSVDVVPDDLHELFAWTVREGVTNVIRHSGAARCEIVLSATSAQVRDNGSGPTLDGASPGTASGSGSGLVGLRERATAFGASLSVESLSPGFCLTVAVA